MVSVRVKEVDADRKRIGLSMKSGAIETSPSRPTASSNLGGKPGGGKQRPEPKSFSAAPPKPSTDDSPFAALKNLKLNK